MKNVEIQKSSSECRMCLDMAVYCNELPPCHACNNETGIVQLAGGEIRKIPISMLKVIEQ